MQSWARTAGSDATGASQSIKRRDYPLLFGRECCGDRWSVASPSLLSCPFHDGLAEHHVPLKRFVCGMSLDVLRQHVNRSIVIPAPRNELPHHLVVDIFNGQAPGVLTPELRDPLDLSQHPSRSFAVGMIPLTNANVVVDEVCEYF